MANITQEQYQSPQIPDVIKVPHPNKDGTWVEFHNMSIRQLEILKDYIKIVK